jgi:hypothetical protein
MFSKNYWSNVFNDFALFVQTFAMTYFVWITLHYACSHLYVEYCVPKGILGFLYSPFMTPMPHCVAMRWVVYNGGKVIEVMWFMAGKWAVEKLVFPGKIAHIEEDPQQQQQKQYVKVEVVTERKDTVPEEVVPENTI